MALSTSIAMTFKYFLGYCFRQPVKNIQYNLNLQLNFWMGNFFALHHCDLYYIGIGGNVGKSRPSNFMHTNQKHENELNIGIFGNLLFDFTVSNNLQLKEHEIFFQ